MEMYNINMENKKLTHIDETGKARMVDISEKERTLRIAIAKGEVVLNRSTIKLVNDGELKKGDVLTIAQIAGIMAAKKTSELVPLCHPIQLNQIKVDLTIDDALPGILIRSEIVTFDSTGAEMEAMVAVSIAAITIYDMVKAVQKDARIMNIRLIEKHGGKSGDIYNE
jgi:cyclic pyranopterin phosphate synthase